MTETHRPVDGERFFADHTLGLTVFREINSELAKLGDCELRVAKTQVGWARRRGFAFLWMPGRWLKHPAADIVLTIYLTRHDDSARWKQVAEVRPGLFAHHLELQQASDLDTEIITRLIEAYHAAE